VEMIRHLSDEQLLDFMLESDQQRLRPVWEDLPKVSYCATEHSDEFWARQRANVRLRIAEANHRPAALPVLAFATIALLIIAAGLMVDLRPIPSTPGGQVQADVDQELLLQVERVLDNGGPEALEPAVVLANEILRAQTSSISPRSPQEGNHEN
jgi:hypothetical protein